ncbi:glutamate synthase (NADPH) small subunit [Malonomonas rubra DSM 5091]|uniref:Glutamate synthase (NADPH) small subunit n=1 Tax=Malonomonas rubra DSM 5091 TaxID=1122189 RepID=A0A1M6I2C1_MALRU|nr:glutamate synthase subunit beta [Malonomonas rubra]SHJ28608.1 glutamate synthase (NADPH) small subunit [Malonomonas rubra DSM 5091]
MQNFVNSNRRDPEKIEAPERLQNFDEIYRLFDKRLTRRQAERCVQCGDPFCTTIGCPLQNHIPQWLEAIANRDLERAFALSNESSPFPEILGRVCPQGHLCEGACTLDDGHGAITIGAIEASITDLAFEAGLQLPFPGIRHDKTVAIVGSGPAGISCAHFLLRAGIGVEMYERAERPGGLLTYGIPGFKLDKEIVDRRFKLLRKVGLNLHLQHAVGEEIALKDLTEKHDAVFIGIGATKGKKGVEGDNLPQVMLAMDYLTVKQHQLFGKEAGPKYDMHGKRVVVIGGGDTAMDCLRTAMRDGAESVSCLYRRDMANMPGSKKEYFNALEEGVEFNFNISPRKIYDKKDGSVCVEVEKTQMGKAGDDGRQRVEILPDTTHCIPADVVILALGFDMEALPGLLDAGVECNKWGEVQIDPETCVTANPKIYAGGDCYRGADLVVTAAADGRRAAFAIMRQLLAT